MNSLKIFSLFDKKSAHFGKPIIAPHHAPLIREFSEAVNDDKSTFSKFPSDFDLYEIGDFDHITGQITPQTNPIHIINLTTLKEIKQESIKNG